MHPHSDSLASPPSWQERGAWCAARPELLTPWERAFVDSLQGRATAPTEKQARILDRLVERRMAAEAGR